MILWLSDHLGPNRESRGAGLLAILAVVWALLMPVLAHGQTRIELHGDSTTNGVTPSGSGYVLVSFTPTKLLQSMLDSACGYGNNVVVDKSQGGLTLEGAMTLPQLAYGGKTLPEHLAVTNAHVIVLGYGLNDAYVPVNKWTFVWYHWVAGLHARYWGKTLVSETSNPITLSPHDATVSDYALTLATNAPLWPQPVADVWSAFTAMPGWPSQVPDGIHPSQLGYFIKALTLFNTLRLHNLVSCPVVAN